MGGGEPGERLVDAVGPQALLGAVVGLGIRAGAAGGHLGRPRLASVRRSWSCALSVLRAATFAVALPGCRRLGRLVGAGPHLRGAGLGARPGHGPARARRADGSRAGIRRPFPSASAAGGRLLDRRRCPVRRRPPGPQGLGVVRRRSAAPSASDPRPGSRRRRRPATSASGRLRAGRGGPDVGPGPWGLRSRLGAVRRSGRATGGAGLVVGQRPPATGRPGIVGKCGAGGRTTSYSAGGRPSRRGAARPGPDRGISGRPAGGRSGIGASGRSRRPFCPALTGAGPPFVAAHSCIGRIRAGGGGSGARRRPVLEGGGAPLRGSVRGRLPLPGDPGPARPGSSRGRAVRGSRTDRSRPSRWSCARRPPGTGAVPAPAARESGTPAVRRRVCLRTRVRATPAAGWTALPGVRACRRPLVTLSGRSSQRRGPSRRRSAGGRGRGRPGGAGRPYPAPGGGPGASSKPCRTRNSSDDSTRGGRGRTGGRWTRY